MARVVVAIDAGTTGVRALAVDEQARVADVAYRELTQHFPRPGWVEHDPAEIWDSGPGHPGRGRRAAWPTAATPWPPSASPTSARRWWPSTARPDGRCTGPSSGRTGAPRRCAPSSPRPGHLPLGARHDGPRARPLLQRHQGGLAAAPRRPRARARRPEPLLLHGRQPGCCGT